MSRRLLLASAPLTMERQQLVAKRPSWLLAIAAQQPGDVALSGVSQLGDLRLR